MAEENEYQPVTADPLKIDLDDVEFADTLDKKIKESRAFFTKKKLYERRKRNEEYAFGREIERLEEEKKIRANTPKYLDNLIFEAERTLKATALSRVPEITVKPGNESDESKQTSETITKIVNNKLRARETRQVLGKAYRHRPVYFVGVIKWRWDSEKGKFGDYRFESIHPHNIDVDHTASSNDAQEMEWIVHHYELSLKEIIMRWPEKKTELFTQQGIDSDQADEKQMATKLRISEVWFTWYDEKEGEWERIEGVAWKYKKIVFDKIKDPYWDWEGEDTLFTFDNETGKRKVTDNEMRDSMMTGVPVPGLVSEKVFHNHFGRPRKPFIFVSHDQWGLQPFDETTRIEQSILLQDNINLRGQQISSIANLALGKNVFSTESGLNAEDVEEIDMWDPFQDILVDGEITKVWAKIDGAQPSAALFQEQNFNRERLFSKMGTNEALRGMSRPGDPATKTQLLKESDFTRIDDEVEDTLNWAAEQMSDAALQMIKLFYTEEHLTSILGKDGRTTFFKINRDLVEDGMEVEVSASSVDKMKRKIEARENARLKFVDPLTYFEDTEAPDPKEKTRRLLLFNLSPELYLEQIVEGRDVQQMADTLGGQEQGQGGRQQALMDIAQLQQGQQPQPPAQPDEEYIRTITEFVKSPEFGNLPPEVQEAVAVFARSLIQASQ